MSLIIQDIKQKIWAAAKKDKEKVFAAMAACGENDNSEKYWKAVLRFLRPKKAPKVQLSNEHYKRYRNAKYAYECIEYPNWIADGHFIEPDTPDTGKANGLTNFITQFLNWSGHRATRISSAGRQLPDGAFIPSTTRKGSADISSTIHGKSVMWEVKVGRDIPSNDQLKEQAKERRAGGEYFFVHNVEEFFLQYDSLSMQKTLF